MNPHPIGERVVFSFRNKKDGVPITAVVVGAAATRRGPFLVRRDERGVERKVRPSACRPA